MTATTTPESAARHAYLRGEVETADGVTLMTRLFNRLIRELRSAHGALEQSRDTVGTEIALQPISTPLQRAREILLHLWETVDSTGGEPAERLAAVYGHAIEQILAAELEKDCRHLAEILPGLEMLRDRWVDLRDADGGRNL